MENLSTVQRQPGYILFIQRRLRVLATLFLFLYATALTIAYFIKNDTLSSSYAWQHWVGFTAWLISYYVVSWRALINTPEQDPYLLHLIFLSCGWGMMMIWRLSPALGLKQTIWLIIGSLVFLFICSFPRVLTYLKQYTYLMLTAVLLLTGLTLIPGLMNSSSQPALWINIRGITFQPSEPLKLIFIVYLSAYFSNRHQLKINKLAILIPTFAVAILAFLILLAQKDLGTTTILVLIYVSMVFLATGNKKWLLGSALLFIAAAIAGYFLFDVIRLRFEAWINPWLDPEGRSYQIIQAMISQAAGGMIGAGPGMGNPNLVPVASSDFIYSAITEESGLIGAAAVIMLIMLTAFRGFTTAIQSSSRFLSLLAMGISTWLAAQSLLIIGGNIRLLPLTGVTLPFFSYGGSSLVTCMLAGAIVTLISGQSENATWQRHYKSRLQNFILPSLLIISIAALLCLPIWSFFQKDKLLSRSDNIRRAIDDFYIPRGNLVDKNGDIINGNAGPVGEYFRVYQYPPLAATTGYSNINYGQSGLEYVLDPYLRGLKSYPDISIWWSNLLLSHPPPGRDVRLSIDLGIQQIIDTLMANHTGAAVILNAHTGEILAITSTPWYDPAYLENEWEKLISDENTPLLNRALNGSYPPGTVLGPLLLAKSFEDNPGTLQIPEAAIIYKGHTIQCSLVTESADSYWRQIQNGCPRPMVGIGRSLGRKGLYEFFSALGFYAQPEFTLPGPPLNDPGKVDNIKAASIGQENLKLTPLQMALAAAAINSGGIIPQPNIATSFQLADDTWELIPPRPKGQAVFSKQSSGEVSNLLALDGIPAWGAIGRALSSDTAIVTWFIGGTNKGWSGVPITIAIVIEDDAAESAWQIGNEILYIITSLSGGD